jgi:hypothetical protein
MEAPAGWCTGCAVHLLDLSRASPHQVVAMRNVPMPGPTWRPHARPVENVLRLLALMYRSSLNLRSASWSGLNGGGVSKIFGPADG